MSCSQVSLYVQRVEFASGGVPVSIAFPTVLIAKNAITNAIVSVGATSDAEVLPTNANRKFAQIVNNSGVLLHIRLGAAAAATHMVFPTGSVFTIEPDTIGEINQQSVHVYNPSGGPEDVSVYEEE